MSTAAALTPGAAALYATFSLPLLIFRQLLVFSRTRAEYPATPGFIDLSWRDVSLITADGIRIMTSFVEGPDEGELYQDAGTSWQWLTDEAGYAPDRIVLFSGSLGDFIQRHAVPQVHR
jgi:hypothetical protein